MLPKSMYGPHKADYHAHNVDLEVDLKYPLVNFDAKGCALIGGSEALPSITFSKESILRELPEIESIDSPIVGGQKIVFPIVIKGQRYALKIIPIEADASDDGDDASSISVNDVFLRIKREVETLNRCNLPQLVKLGPVPMSLIYIDDGPKIVYTEEWIDGKSLREIIKSQGRVPVSDVLRMAIDMTKAIETLWSVSKIHRDVKPENIIRRSDGSFVLLDLGFALDLDDISLTGSDKICGTVPYYSPEQTNPANKRKLDFRSDLYSLGVVMLEALTGSNPFLPRDGSIEETVRSIQTKEIRRPLNIRDVSPDLETLVLRLLAKEPHLRFRSCKMLLDSLNMIKEGMVGESG